MAAPAFVAASTGATDATGGWTATCHAPGAADRIIVLQFLADGTNASYPTISSTTNIKDLAGTSGQWTRVTAAAGENVGSPKVASQHIYIGRSASTSAPVVTGANVGGDDVYWRFYEFTDVSTGTTLATVIENGTAGSIVNGAGTSATVSDSDVTTLGADRLALNFVGINDDNAIAAFAGETGGDWTEAVAEYADATGTDASIGLQLAYLSLAGSGLADGGPLNVYGGTGTEEQSAQSFSLGSNATVSTIRLLVGKNGTPTDDLTVEVQTDSSGVPSGTVVGSGGSLSCSGFTSSARWQSFSVNASLTASTTYWLVVRRSGARDATNYPWVVPSTTSNPYSGGTAAQRNSGTWSNVTNQDLAFVVTDNAAGTIGGGTFTQADATDGWGVVGFALIGTTAASAFAPVPPNRSQSVLLRL